MTWFHYWEKNYHSIGLCPTSIACSCSQMDSGFNISKEDDKGIEVCGEFSGDRHAGWCNFHIAST